MMNKCDIYCSSDKNSVDNTERGQGGPVGKEERKRQVLKLLVESGLALPPAVIFWNCKDRGSTFERRTVDNYLSELEEDGYIKKVDQDRGYYKATEKGRKYYLDQ